jgi:hypothetical protein
MNEAFFTKTWFNQFCFHVDCYGPLDFSPKHRYLPMGSDSVTVGFATRGEKSATPWTAMAEPRIWITDHGERCYQVTSFG